MGLDQRRVLEKTVGHDAQLAPGQQVARHGVEEALGDAGVVAHAGMKGWIADHGGKAAMHVTQTITGIDLGVHVMLVQGLTRAIERQCIDIDQLETATRIAPRQHQAEHPCPAAEIQHLARRQRRHLLQQQRTALIQPAMAEHPGRLVSCTFWSGKSRSICCCQSSSRKAGASPLTWVRHSWQWRAESSFSAPSPKPASSFSARVMPPFFSPTRYSGQPAASSGAICASAYSARSMALGMTRMAPSSPSTAGHRWEKLS